MAKKILISGGAGFIGFRLALNLTNRGHEVTVLDNLSEQIHDAESIANFEAKKGSIKFIKGDVRNKSDWKKAIADNEVIVHLAAETGTGQSMYEIEKYTEVNITGTSIMLDLLTNEEHQVSRVVVASSRSIYGEGKYLSKELGMVYPKHRLEEDLLAGKFEVTYPGSSALELQATDEESKIHPSSVYGITKQVQEQLVMTVCPTINIEPVAFRYQNVYGPGQSLSNPYTGILSIFSTQIKNGNSINIFEDGLESRDFVFIDDIVDATTLGVEKEEAAGEVFNVGAGVATTVNEVAETLIKNYGTDTSVTVTGNFRLGDIRHNYADMSKIKEKLGFEPQYNFQQGIQKFTEWVNEQEVKADNYNQAMDEMKAKGLFK
jgi:dTDP-L-rhamnose 4-epimerase